MRNRQRRIDAGEDPEVVDQEMKEEEEKEALKQGDGGGEDVDLMADFVDQSSGNIPNHTKFRRTKYSLDKIYWRTKFFV